MTGPSTANAAPMAGRFGKVEVIPLAGSMGAEVRGLNLATLDDEGYALLHRAYLDHVLVVLREQSIDDVRQVEVSRRFGPLESPPAATERATHQHFDGPPEVTVVSNRRVNGVPIGELGDGEVIWHSDYSFREVIAGMRMLRAVMLPPAEAGGNTRFANGYAAYQALPDRLKDLVHGRTIKHDAAYDTNRNLRRGAVAVEDLRQGKGPDHPIVSTHPDTGCNALFLGRRFRHYVNGLSLADSEALLDELWSYLVDERNVIEHHWREGDVVLWDNRCSVHQRGPFDSATERELHATQVRGHRPVEAPDARSRPAHPRAAAH